MNDPIHDHLDELHQALIKDAEAAGEGPKTMTRAKFQSVMERQSFIAAFGQKAYDNLKD